MHTGYLKIRKKLGELKNKRASERRSGSTRNRSRSRSRSPRGNRRDRDSHRDRDRDRRGGRDELDGEHFEKQIIFSSKKLGSGANVPSESIGTFKFANIAMQQNHGYSGDFVEMGMTSLGKEWRYYKRELDNARRKAKKDKERREE